MNVLILGAGEVGSNIARRLLVDGANVVVVDRDAELLRHIGDSMDVKTVCGHASLPSVLERAGAEDADLLIAATTNDEVNMLACQVAHSLFKVPTKIARVREHEYVQREELCGRDDLPIDVIISPETEAASAVVRRFRVASAADVQEFAGGRITLVGLRIPPKSDLAGVSLMDFGELMTGHAVNIVAHEHNQQWRVPSGDTVLLAGDAVYAAMDSWHVNVFLDAAGVAHAEGGRRSVMVVGGGHIGYIVAQKMEELGVALKVIEYDAERARWLAEHLDHAVVIAGNALDRELLEEENIGAMDAFVTLTNDDETNILASLIARKYQVPHILTLVNRSIYSDLIKELGLEATISPRLTTVSTVMSHIRKGRILGMYSLGDGTLEVVEAEALETSDILNVPLRELKLPPETLIGAILRDGEVIVPRGDTSIRAHDRIVLVAPGRSLQAVEKLFEVHLEFF